MAILKFSFTSLGETRQSAMEELDSAIRAAMTNLGGEPWITVEDGVKKILIGPDPINPANYAYIAQQEVFFSGPTVLGKDIAQFRDGFRPQTELGFDGFPGL